MSCSSGSKVLMSLPLVLLILVALLASLGTCGSDDFNINYASIAGQRPLIRWNPCQAISYAVNLRRVGNGGRQDQLRALMDVQEALRMIAQASGLTFVFRGVTDEIPRNRWGGDWYEHQRSAELVIAWVGDDDSDLLDYGAAGTGGWSMKAYSVDGGRNYHAAIGRGFVLLRASEQHKFSHGFGIGSSRGALLLHEILHALGMGHVSSKAEIMYPRLDNDYTMARFGRGDLNGLKRIGADSGCFPVPREQWVPL